MWWIRKNQPRRLTGVGTVLSAAHRDQKTGSVHGHTWEITAWFLYDGRTDQSVRKYELEQVVKVYDHTCLPDKLAWGEALAEYIARSVNAEYANYELPSPCVAVDVSRPSERIYARWQA